MEKSGGCLRNLSGCGMLLCFVMTVACGMVGCNDLQFAHGDTKTAEATFLKFRETTSMGKYRNLTKGTGSSKHLVFEFIDNKGNERSGTDLVSKDWTPPISGKFAIEYQPGKIETGTRFTVSRLKGSGGFICKTMFYIGAVGLVMCLIGSVLFPKGQEDD